MRFFSRIAFICNACFIIAVILRYWELSRQHKMVFDGLVKLQPLESTLVILGYGAILTNILFAMLMLLFFVFRVKPDVPVWIKWFNFLLLPLQVYYFFF